jgi:hypothetical protein
MAKYMDDEMESDPSFVRHKRSPIWFAGRVRRGLNALWLELADLVEKLT